MKSKLFMLIFILVNFLLPYYVWSSNANLIANGDFENHDSQSLLPTNWKAKGPGLVLIDKTIKANGFCSLKIENHDNLDYTSVIQNISVKPNTYYVFAGWVKGENIEKGKSAAGGARFFIGTYGGSRAVVGGDKLFGTFDWQEIRIPFYSGENAVVAIIPYLHLCSGTFWFDNLRLYELEY